MLSQKDSSKEELSVFKQALFALLENKKTENLIITNETQRKNRNQAVYYLRFNKTQLDLILEKTNSKEHYIYHLEDKYLLHNNVRKDHSFISEFNQKVHQIGMHLNNGRASLFCEKAKEDSQYG